MPYNWNAIRKLIAFGDAGEFGIDCDLPPSMVEPRRWRDRTMAQGNATAEFLKNELRHTDEVAIKECVTQLHYGRHDVPFSGAKKAAKGSGMSQAAKDEAKYILKWIRDRPAMLDAHLQDLQRAIEPFLVRKVGPSECPKSEKSDQTRRAAML